MITKPFLIAEIGINHNGDIEIVKRIIDYACLYGFNSVKFQKRTINKVYSKEILDSKRESPWGTTFRDQKEGLEFDFKEYSEIDNYCKKKNIIWFASAWDDESLVFLDQFNLDYHKVASPMIVDLDFLNSVAKRKKHTFISTGMSDIKDIDNAVKIFRENECGFELMHCVSEYPLKDSDVNLNTITALKEKYNVDVGYSGHENGALISQISIMLGISSLERHVTLDRTMYGSDQSASMEPEGMQKLIEGIDKIISAVGLNKIGHITENEKINMKKLRAHIKNT
jgi:N-acetylneuraminate synthase